MLTMVTAENPQSGTLLLPLMDSSGGYVVKEIQGLDPVKATLVSTSIAQMDGAHMQNARREPRNILMKLGFEPDYINNTVASLRSDLYHFFMPKSAVTYGLYSDGVAFGKTEAIVESMDNNMFTADPEVDISMICYDPDFYAPDATELDFVTVADTNTQPVDYPGTSDAGVIFTIVFQGTASEISLHNTRPDNQIQTVSIAGSFLADDKLVVNTNPGSKSLILTRAGLDIPVLYYLDLTSTWISLGHGINRFRAFFSGSPIPYTLEYTARYGGF